jgi:outer membrane murein-binding lipoprotein Lpp
MRNSFFTHPALCPVRRIRGGLVLFLLLSLLLIGCQSKTPEEQLLKAVQPVGSWLASLEMTGRKWNANSVPASFVRNTTAAARKEIDKASEEAGKSTARPGLRDPIRKLLAEAGDAGDGLRRAVDQGDRGGVAREVGRLAALHARFEALTKGAA